MITYTPNKWAVVKVSQNGETHYRVFACWYGGFTLGNSWKLNSGITQATFEEDCYHFEGSSRSVYVCHKDSYGTSTYGNTVLNTLIQDASKNGTIIEILPEHTNFLELKYE